MGKNRVSRKLEKLAALKARLVSAINAAINENGLQFNLVTATQLVVIKWIYLSEVHGFYGVECILRNANGFYRKLFFIAKDGSIQDNEYYQLRNLYEFEKLIYTV